jgi:hypothetical protein
MFVARIINSSFVQLSGQYNGLNGVRSTYRIAADSVLNGSRYGIATGVWQDVGVESIPLFQFAIFYNMDLEMNPSPAMVVTGRVHSNSNIFTVPSTSLTFSNSVTACGLFEATNFPTDPMGLRGMSMATITNNLHFGPNANVGMDVSTLNLPIGTNNQPSNVFAVLQIPPAGESPTSAMGTNRMYNLADMIIVVSNNSVTAESSVQSGANNLGLQWTNFMTTNVTFYDERENVTQQVSQIDVGALRTWAGSSANILKTNSWLTTGAPMLETLYVADMRSPYVAANSMSHGTNVMSHGTNVLTYAPVENSVRLVNGSELPADGFTLATPNPIFVKGDYNTTTNDSNFSSGANSTAYANLAALMGDAIVLLSNNWNDNNSNASLSGRTATSTTVNSALLGGIVVTTPGAYSGGVENFPRFLENWGSATLWYNGSMVVMFNSHTATNAWNNNANIYDPPTRKWAFDQRFTTNQPPHTPQILFMERLGWTFANPNSDPNNTNTWY